MNRFRNIILLCVTLYFSNPTTLLAQTNADYLLFNQLFTNWTNDFNNKNLQGSCALFSHSVIANYQGIPEKNYQSICDGFKKIFNEKNKQYQYRFKLHDVYRSDKLATVRITWYLSVFEEGEPIAFTQDEGIDIFKENEDGQWKIVNYIAYPVMGEP